MFEQLAKAQSQRAGSTEHKPRKRNSSSYAVQSSINQKSASQSSGVSSSSRRTSQKPPSMPKTEPQDDTKPWSQPVRTPGRTLTGQSHPGPPPMYASSATANPTTSNMSMPNPPASATFEQQNMPLMPNNGSNVTQPGSFSEMSAMMFPSGDPFAYPNQPMLTWEQSGPYNQQQSVPGEFGPFMPNTTGVSQNPDRSEMQFYGQMQSFPQNEESPSAANLSTSPTYPGSMQGDFVPANVDNMWDQQARNHGLSGMNFDDIFSGEDWRQMRSS